MSVVFDEVITEVDTPKPMATSTQKEPSGQATKESYQTQLAKTLRHQHNRKLRLSAE